MTFAPNMLTAANGAGVPLPQAMPGQKPDARSLPIAPWASESELVPTKGYGLDLDGGGDRNAAEHWRYQTAYIALTLAAGSWTLPAETSLEFWTVGQGDDVQMANPPAGFVPWKMTRSETDLYKGGAPVPRDFVFRIRSLGFALGLPFALPDPANPSMVTTDALTHYSGDILSKLWDVLGVNLSFNEEACSYEVGLAQFHAMPTGKVSGSDKHFRGGAGIGVVNMLPLRGSVWAGARDEANQLSVKVTSPKVAVSIQQNPAFPIEADVIVPVTFQAYGASYISCPPAVCATPAVVNDAQLEAAVRRVLGK